MNITKRHLLKPICIAALALVTSTALGDVTSYSDYRIEAVVFGGNEFTNGTITVYPQSTSREALPEPLPYNLEQIRFTKGADNQYTKKHDAINMFHSWYKFPLDSQLFDTSEKFPICDLQVLKKSPIVKDASMLASTGNKDGCMILLELRNPKSALSLLILTHKLLTNDSIANLKDTAIDSKFKFLKSKYAILSVGAPVKVLDDFTHNYQLSSSVVMMLVDNKGYFKGLNHKYFGDKPLIGDEQATYPWESNTTSDF